MRADDVSVAVCIVDVDLKAWELKLYFVAIVRLFIFQPELASPLDYYQILGQVMLLRILLLSVTIGTTINNHVITM